MSKLDIPIINFRLGGFDEARENIERLIWDTGEITRGLKKVKGQRWDIPIKKGPYIRFPMALAYELIPRDLILRYIDQGYVDFILASIIKESIWDSPVQSKDLRKKLRKSDSSEAFKLAKMKSGDLKGLGDLQILALCSIRSQFMGQRHFTFVALTADETLSDVLHEFSNISLSSGNLRHGDPQAERQLKRFVDEWQIQERVMNLQNTFWREFNRFLADVLQRIEDSQGPTD